MQIIFKLRVNVYSLCVHLRNCPAFFQQFIDTNKIFVFVNIILLGKITAVAYVDYLLHCFTPLLF